MLRPLGWAAAAACEGLFTPMANFSDNAGLPGMVVNSLLQGGVGGAARNTRRFLLNTTVGVPGLANPAVAIDLTKVEADFGGALAVGGVPEGAYLDLPGFGPRPSGTPWPGLSTSPSTRSAPSTGPRASWRTTRFPPASARR